MFVPACLLSDWWKTKLELADVWVEIAMANGDICSTRQTMGGGGAICVCVTVKHQLGRVLEMMIQITQRLKLLDDR